MAKARKTQRLMVFVSLLGFCLSLGSALAEVNDSAWLQKTSLVAKGCPAYRGPLYRGIRGDFFPMSRIVRNMLGDLTAEHASWRVSNLGGGKSDVDGKKWKALKEKAAEEIATRDRCEVVSNAAAYTNIYLKAKDKKTAQAIALSPSFLTAYVYSNFGHMYADPKGEGHSIIQVKEHVKRAARYVDDEYYIPIVIPAEDITQGWSNGLRAIKEVGADGALKQITFYEDDLKYVAHTRDSNISPSAPLTPPIAKIIVCPDGVACSSDANLVQDPRLQQTALVLSTRAFDGHRYVLQKPDFKFLMKTGASSDSKTKPTQSNESSLGSKNPESPNAEAGTGR